jgi:hypothetical protein
MKQVKHKPFTISDLYLAYRKAKAEAFYENTHFHALAFAEYELSLDGRLRHLLELLNDSDAEWTTSAPWLGGYSYSPKSIELPSVDADERVFYRFLDPIEDWQRQFADAGGKPIKANFRLFITSL